MKHLACRDLGVACDFVASAENDEEVMNVGAAHAKEVHGYTDADFTPEFMEKAKSAIKEA